MIYGGTCRGQLPGAASEARNQSDPGAYTPSALQRSSEGESALENQVMILVVEDDQLIQGVIEEALTDGGFETTIASSGEEAIEPA